MIKNYFKIAWRSLLKNRTSSIQGGLSMADALPVPDRDIGMEPAFGMNELQFAYQLVHELPAHGRNVVIMLVEVIPGHLL